MDRARAPKNIGSLNPTGAPIFAPSPELAEWVRSPIPGSDGCLHNPGHAHLIDGDIEFLRASSGFEKQGRLVLGKAEQVMFRAGGWQKLRQEQQMEEWFGHMPAFLITVSRCLVLRVQRRRLRRVS